MNLESVVETKGIKKVKNYYVYMNDCLGKGAFSSVYKGKKNDPAKTQLYVAVKQIDINERTNMNEMKEESKILKSLDHPNIIKLYDTAKTAKHYYLFLEFCEQGDLKKFIQKQYNGSVFEKHAKQFFHDILEGYKYLVDQKIAHRDLKLANILITNTYKLKISDFGFAKMKEENEFMMSYKGTPLNMAPEILFDRNYDFKCDIWSLGTILYELLYGEPFVKVKNEAELRSALRNFKAPVFPENKKNVSQEAKDLVSSLLKKIPNERISIENALKHPWFSSLSASNEASDELIKSVVQVNIKKPEPLIRKSLTKEDYNIYFVHLIKDHILQELCRKMLIDIQEKAMILKEVAARKTELLENFPLHTKFINRCFQKIVFLTKQGFQDISCNYAIKEKIQSEVGKLLESDKSLKAILAENSDQEKIKKSQSDSQKDDIDILDEHICKGIEKMGQDAALMEYKNMNNYQQMYSFILIAIKILKLTPLSMALAVEVNIPMILKEYGKEFYLALATFPKSLGEIMSWSSQSINLQTIEELRTKVTLQKYVKVSSQSEENQTIMLEVTSKLEKMLEEKLLKPS